MVGPSNLNTVAPLLSKGARVDTRSKDGFTPLLKAANEGKNEVCELLIASGSDVEEKDEDGFTLLLNAVFC